MSEVAGKELRLSEGLGLRIYGHIGGKGLGIFSTQATRFRYLCI